MKKNLKITILIVLFLSFVSKILGFFRDLLITNYIGFNEKTDALFIALSLVTLLFSAFNTTVRTTFAPLFSARYNNDKEQVLKEYIDLRNVLVFILTLITILIFLNPNLILKIFTPGISGVTLIYASRILKWLSFLLISYGIFYITTGFLQAIKVYKTVEVASLFNNISIICMILVFFEKIGIYSVIIGYLTGSVIQAVYSSIIFKVKTRFNFSNFRINNINKNEITDFFKLSKYVLLGSVITQLTVFSDKFVASFLNTGSITALHYSNIVKNLPLTIVILVVTNILFTNLSIYYKESKTTFFNILEKQLNYLLFFVSPIVIIFFLYSFEIIKLIFFRGEFTLEGVKMTALALSAYSPGLFFWVFKEVFSKASYASKNTKIPLFVTIISLIINISLNFLLSIYYGHVGIAVATSISLFINSYVIMALLKRYGVISHVSNYYIIGLRHIIPLTLLTILMYYIKLFVLSSLPYTWNLILGSLIIMVAYILIAKKLGVNLNGIFRKEVE